MRNRKVDEPESITMGALDPKRMATAPAPPVGWVAAVKYVAMSAATTRASRPVKIEPTSLHFTNRSLHIVSVAL